MKTALALLLTGAAVAVAMPLVAQARSEATASQFAVYAVRLNLNAQFGRLWPLLHPRYQAVTTRSSWEACKRREHRENATVEWLSVRAIAEYGDTPTLPLLGRVRTTAVTIRARVRLLGQVRTITDTLYVVRLRGRWKGTWDPEEYRAYRAGRCPQ